MSIAQSTASFSETTSEDRSINTSNPADLDMNESVGNLDESVFLNNPHTRRRQKGWRGFGKY